MNFLVDNKKIILTFLAILIFVLYGFYCHAIGVREANLVIEKNSYLSDTGDIGESKDEYIYGEEDTSRLVVLPLNSLMRFSLNDEVEEVNGYKKFSYVTVIDDFKIELANYDLYLRISKNTFSECEGNNSSFYLKILDNDKTSIISSNYFNYNEEAFDIESKEGFYRITTLSSYENADNWTFEFYALNNDSCNIDAVFNAEVLLVDTNKSLYNDRLLINALLEDNGGKDLIDNKSVINSVSYEELNDGVHYTQDNDGVSYYTRGTKVNNYLLYNDTYYNIMRINGNNTIRIMYSQSNSENDFYGTYEEVNAKIEKWVETNFVESDILLSGNYCIKDEIDYNNIDLICEDNYITNSKVGLITVNEMLLAGKSINLDEEYKLNDNINYWLMESEYILYNNKTIFKNIEEEINYALPVINIDNVLVSGTGTYSDPYIIN